MAAINSGTFTIFSTALDDHASLIDANVADVNIFSNGTLELTLSDGSIVNNSIPYFSDFVVTGVNLTQQAIPNASSIDYTTGTYQINGVVYNIAIAGTLVLNPGDPLFPRYDLIYVDTTNNINFITGTPSATPTIPATLPNTLAIATVYVQANASAATGGYYLQTLNVFVPNSILPGGVFGQTTYWDGTAWIPTSQLNTDGTNYAFNIAPGLELLNINGRIELQQTTAPGITTDKLYNVLGDLYWNGILLSGGGILPIGTVPGSHMYWDGASWVENINFLYNSGTTSWDFNGVALTGNVDINFQTVSGDHILDSIRLSGSQITTSSGNDLDLNTVAFNDNILINSGNDITITTANDYNQTTTGDIDISCSGTMTLGGNGNVTVDSSFFDVNIGALQNINLQTTNSNISLISGDNIQLNAVNQLQCVSTETIIDTLSSDTRITLDSNTHILSLQGGLYFSGFTPVYPFTNGGIAAIAQNFLADNVVRWEMDANEGIYFNASLNPAPLGWLPYNIELRCTEGLVEDTSKCDLRFQTFSLVGPTTLTQNEYIIYADTSSNAVGITLPASPTTGRIYKVKDKGNASTNNITVNGNGNTIDGFVSYIMNVDYSSITLHFDGTEWFVL